MSVILRNNVRVSGVPGATPMLFVHGYGCDQAMWRHVAPAFEASHTVVTLDLVGAGGSDLSAYDPERYSTLDAYAEDLLDVVRELDLHDVVLVGHSVSAMIGALAVVAAPERFSRLVMVAPSPRYLDDPADGYVGGFTEADITELLESLDGNYLGWSQAMAPVIMGNEDRPELGVELTTSFCRTDPAIARAFARVTFLSDTREQLREVGVPTLVLQCSSDVIAPLAVGSYVADAVKDSTLVVLEATGHCPNLSAPAETSRAIEEFVAP